MQAYYRYICIAIYQIIPYLTIVSVLGIAVSPERYDNGKSCLGYLSYYHYILYCLYTRQYHYTRHYDFPGKARYRQNCPDYLITAIFVLFLSRGAQLVYFLGTTIWLQFEHSKSRAGVACWFVSVRFVLCAGLSLSDLCRCCMLVCLF